MPNGGCIFCKIIRREIPARIVYEDDYSLAFLDIQPRSKGMCIVASKRHITDFNEDPELAKKVFEAAMIVAEKIRKALNPLTIFMSIMRTQIPHFHIRVYPVYKDQIPIFENRPIEIPEEEMNMIAHRIMSVDVSAQRKPERIEEKSIIKEVIEKPKEEEREKPEERKVEDKGEEKQEEKKELRPWDIP